MKKPYQIIVKQALEAPTIQPVIAGLLSIPPFEQTGISEEQYQRVVDFNAKIMAFVEGELLKDNSISAQQSMDLIQGQQRLDNLVRDFAPRLKEYERVKEIIKESKKAKFKGDEKQTADFAKQQQELIAAKSKLTDLEKEVSEYNKRKESLEKALEAAPKPKEPIMVLMDQVFPDHAEIILTGTED